MSSYETLLTRVRLVRRRWRITMLVKGIALFLASVVVLLLAGIYGADLFGFRPAAIWSVRCIAASAALVVLFRYLYRPLCLQATDLQIAQFVEERYPELEDRLVTAVELGGAPGAGSGMLDLLIRDALEKTSRLDLSVFSGKKRRLKYAGVALLSLLILQGLITWGPPFVRFGFERLYMPWAEAAVESGRMIVVTPGHTELARGSNLQVKARLVGFDSPEVNLYVKADTAAVWSPLAMDPEPQGSSFLYLLVDVQDSLRYYVEAKGVRSSEYAIGITSGQQVKRIDLRYTFPDYTGMAAQLVENEGDISALKGTRVEVRVEVDRPVRSARILFDDSSALPLNPTGGKAFTGNLILTRAGSYVIQLESERGIRFTASPEYEIRALDDAPPRIAISKPQRDVRATNVEEVFTELKAEDDVGVGRVELHYSVNGGEEQILRLYDGKPKQTAVTASRAFFLEEFGLQPGDLISYFGKAFDTNAVTGPGSASSDIYFIQIRPFEQKYTQSQQGGSAGGEAQEALSKQQKEIISATYRLIRDKRTMDPGEYVDGLKALTLVQSRLQIQTLGLLERLKRRGVAGINEEFARLAGYYQTAAGQMDKAAGQLGAQKPSEALPDEQRSLQQLLRAESLFREIQVSFAAQMNGGAGTQSNSEDLAELFELELNKLKNQYETVQRGEQQARDQKLDEAMERLKELAQRQQQLNERARALTARGIAAASRDGGQGQQQVLEDAIKLQRQLQRLSRERSSTELNQVSSQLDRAIREMQKALKRAGSGSTQEVNARGARALQQLEEALQALARGQQTGLIQGLEQASEESRQFLQEQSAIQESVNQLIQNRLQAPSQDLEPRLKELSERKSQFADRVRNLGEKIEDLSAAARKAQRETSERLNGAAALIREKKLPERILSGNLLLSNGYLDLLKGREDSVRAGLEELNRQLEAAKEGIGHSREDKLEEAVNHTRALVDGLESLQRQLEGETRSQRATESTNGQPGRSDPGQTLKPSEQRGGLPALGRQTGRGSFSPDGTGQGQIVGGSPPGAVRPADEERRQWRREAQERLVDAQALRRLLDRNSANTQNLERVIEAVREAAGAGKGNDGELAARLKAAVDMLHAVDHDLSRELDQLSHRERYLSADDNEVPDSYRALVEEYYRALARRKP